MKICNLGMPKVGHVMTANLYTLKGFLSVNAVAKQMKEQGLIRLYATLVNISW